MNDSPSRSVDTPPNVEPNAPDSGEKHRRSGHEGERVNPRENPLIELPTKTEPEMPAKPQEDVPFANPPRAGRGGVVMANDDTSPDDTLPPDTEPARQPWQAPSTRSPWMTQNLRAMPLPIPMAPLPFPSMPR